MSKHPYCDKLIADAMNEAKNKGFSDLDSYITYLEQQKGVNS